MRAHVCLSPCVCVCIQVTKSFKYTDVTDVVVESRTLFTIKYATDHDFVYESPVGPQVAQELKTR